jgi:hypothetical protein
MNSPSLGTPQKFLCIANAAQPLAVDRDRGQGQYLLRQVSTFPRRSSGAYLRKPINPAFSRRRAKRSRP